MFACHTHKCHSYSSASASCDMSFSSAVFLSAGAMLETVTITPTLYEAAPQRKALPCGCIAQHDLVTLSHMLMT